MQNTTIRDLESHHFQRPELVERIVQDLTGQIAFSDGRNGIFLAAPRRTGKIARRVWKARRSACNAAGGMVIKRHLLATPVSHAAG